MKITNSDKKVINNIFDKASKEGRTNLYEYEVYQILDGIGLEVPKFHYIEKSNEVTEKVLSDFGEEIIVKIVSSDIIHKQKYGGVKKVRNHEPLFVQYVLDKMQEEVLSHFDDNKPSIEGFLLVELIQFKQSIGYEVLFGVKDDPSFGPVVTLSKGGDDAEFFAKYYDKANLFLPHLSYNEALKTTNQLKIKHKFTDHPEYMELMAKGASIISSLAYDYSYVSEDNPEYYIKTMDINPFVITNDNRFVAVDGFIEFEKADSSKKKLPIANETNLTSFFNPKGVAVIGVSSDVNKYSMAREIAQLLHDLGREDLYCVNVKGGETYFGDKKYKLYKSYDEIEEDVELVVYAAPAKFTTNFFADLNNKVPKAVVLIPGIPQEIKYADFELMLRKVVKNSIRIIGPNCMGVFYGGDEKQKGVNTLFIEEERLHLTTSKYSNTALLTQSGAMAITLIDKMVNAPLFKAIVSFGNKFDVKIIDLMKHFKDDDNIEVIALYIEGFAEGEGRAFYALAGQISKPIIVYKSGKTDAGAKAAASHTAAMTGDYDVFEAACNQSSVILVEEVKAYHDIIKAFSLLSNKRVKGKRVAGVLNAGFEATVAADELGILEPAVLTEKTQKRINELNVHGLVDTNTSILDVTPMTDDILYRDFIEAVMQDDNVDCVFVGIVPHVENIKSTPDTCRDKDSFANLVVDLSRKYNKPLVISVNAGEYYKDFVSIMEKAGLPVYSDIRSAVKSLESFIKYNIGNK